MKPYHKLQLEALKRVTYGIETSEQWVRGFREGFNEGYLAAMKDFGGK